MRSTVSALPAASRFPRPRSNAGPPRRCALAQQAERLRGEVDAGLLAPGEDDRVGFDAAPEQDELIGFGGNGQRLADGEVAFGAAGAGDGRGPRLANKPG